VPGLSTLEGKVEKKMQKAVTKERGEGRKEAPFPEGGVRREGGKGKSAPPFWGGVGTESGQTLKELANGEQRILQK